MLPQLWDFGATAYLSPDKARLKYRRRENKTGKTKLKGNNECLIKKEQARTKMQVRDQGCPLVQRCDLFTLKHV